MSLPSLPGTIASPAQSQVLSDPLALEILMILMTRRATAAEVAETLNILDLRAVHYLKQLEDQGLLKTEVDSQLPGIEQVYYSAVLKDLVIQGESPLLSHKAQGLRHADLVLTGVRRTLLACGDSIQTHHVGFIGIRCPKSKIDWFVEKLKALELEFADLEDTSFDEWHYMAAILYPGMRPSSSNHPIGGQEK